jgi:hypothetical protein
VRDGREHVHRNHKRASGGGRAAPIPRQDAEVKLTFFLSIAGCAIFRLRYGPILSISNQEVLDEQICLSEISRKRSSCGQCERIDHSQDQLSGPYPFS